MSEEEEINTKNILAEIRAANVRKIMAARELTAKDMHELTGASVSTMHNCFGEDPRSSPSPKTIERMTEAFGLAPDALDKADFNPSVVVLKVAPKAKIDQLPVVIPQTQIIIQIGKTTITTEVDESLAEKILRLVVLGDNL